MRINGIGTIDDSKKIADIYSAKCSHCNNTVTFELLQHVKKFTMYWIPVTSWHKQFYTICPICGHGQKISVEEAELLKQQHLPILK